MIKIIPLGGIGEIGMNCLYIESNGSGVLVDCGMMFSDLEHFGVDFVVPKFEEFAPFIKNLKAIAITHGHEDHIGALPFARFSGIEVPIYAPRFATALIRKKFLEYGIKNQKEKLLTYGPGETIQVGEIYIRPVPVTHSIVDAYAFIIDTPDGTIIHTGDFVIDRDPVIGDPFNIDPFKEAGDRGVLALLSDSTNSEVLEKGLNEKEAAAGLKKEICDSEGRVIVTLFSSNISRIRSVLEIAKLSDRKVCFLGRSFENYLDAAGELNLLDDLDDWIVDSEELKFLPDKKQILIVTGSQAEGRSTLARIANGDHKHIKIQKGDRILFSSKMIPGNEVAIGRLVNKLLILGADVVSGRNFRIHASGHACSNDLKEVLEAVRPKYFMPVHGEYKHLVAHAKISQSLGRDENRIIFCPNGKGLNLEKDRFEVFETIEDGKQPIEGSSATGLSKELIKLRRKLAEDGFGVALLIKSKKSNKILHREFIPYALGDSEFEFEIIERANAAIETALVRSKRGEPPYHRQTLNESIRIDTRKCVSSLKSKKPTVIPIVIEV